MVAVMKVGSSLRNIVTYNENKVKEGVAECIAAVNYPKDLEWLSFGNKLNRLTYQAALRPTVTANAVHFSLNFDPSENLSKEKLKEIADTYMRKLGMDDLPYLVYQHFDAGHPHVHIATVKVRANGDRVETDFVGKNESSKAREEIEIEYGLIQAKGRNEGEDYKVQAVNVQKAIYGRIQTKRAITNVLTEVIDSYKYATLAELNSILKLYNVTADVGSDKSRINQHRGLTYRILDENGNKVGVPIKASLFYNKPTLKNIEAKFKKNEIKRVKHLPFLKKRIDQYFLGNDSPSLEGLKEALIKHGISVLTHTAKNGMLHGITFVDHKFKYIFNGRQLGTEYGINGILERINNPAVVQKKIAAKATPTKNKSRGVYEPNKIPNDLFKIPYYRAPHPAAFALHKFNGWIDVVLGPEYGCYEPIPYQFLNGRYKKTRKKAGN